MTIPFFVIFGIIKTEKRLQKRFKQPKMLSLSRNIPYTDKQSLILDEIVVSRT